MRQYVHKAIIPVCYSSQSIYVNLTSLNFSASSYWVNRILRRCDFRSPSFHKFWYRLHAVVFFIWHGIPQQELKLSKDLLYILQWLVYHSISTMRPQLLYSQLTRSSTIFRHKYRILQYVTYFISQGLQFSSVFIIQMWRVTFPIL